MGIEILPPDVNEGEAGFSVAGNAIRYALTAVKELRCIGKSAQANNCMQSTAIPFLHLYSRLHSFLVK